MKVLNWLGTIVIILLIVAAITAPGDKKFENFIAKDKGGDTMSCKPIIGKTTQVKLLVRLCTITTVSYCETNKSSLGGGTKLHLGIKAADGSDSVTALKITIPKVTSTETYLGLFGRFWKI